MEQPDEDIIEWMKELQEGEGEAANRIWHEYFPRLVGLARSILKTRGRGDKDEEDVAASALKSFYTRAQDGRFPNLNDGDGLWKLLMTITIRKAFRVNRRNTRYAGVDPTEWFKSLPDQNLSPDDAALAIDEIDRLMTLLPDERTREIVLARLEGCTHQEVADRVGCSISTVERKLKFVRNLWIERG